MNHPPTPVVQGGKWDKELVQLQTVTGSMERERYIRLLEDNKGDVGTVVGILLSFSDQNNTVPAPAPAPPPAPPKWEKELQQLRGLFGQIDEVRCVQLLGASNGDVHHVANKLFDT
jgi:hypothetical protein